VTQHIARGGQTVGTVYTVEGGACGGGVDIKAQRKVRGGQPVGTMHIVGGGSEHAVDKVYNAGWDVVGTS
jgi:hypothetical protein